MSKLNEEVEEQSLIPKKEMEKEENKELLKELQPLPLPLSIENGYKAVKEAAEAMDAMMGLASVLIESKMCPLKNKSDVVLAITTGNQYGFPFMTSINSIFPIQGKPTMSAHLQRALLLQKGIVFKKVYDDEPLYTFYKANEKGEAIKIKDKAIPICKGTMIEKPDVPHVFLEKDRITKYYFKRAIKLANGEWSILETYSEFKMSDAAKAQLLDKENWIKYPSRMLDARAFTIGAREVASDILLGIYSINELADANNLKYTMDDNFQEAVIVDQK